MANIRDRDDRGRSRVRLPNRKLERGEQSGGRSRIGATGLRAISRLTGGKVTVRCTAVSYELFGECELIWRVVNEKIMESIMDVIIARDILQHRRDRSSENFAVLVARTSSQEARSAPHDDCVGARGPRNGKLRLRRGGRVEERAVVHVVQVREGNDRRRPTRPSAEGTKTQSFVDHTCHQSAFHSTGHAAATAAKASSDPTRNHIISVPGDL